MTLLVSGRRPVARRGRQAAALPDTYTGVHATYVAQLDATTMLDDDTRRAYASRVPTFLIWLDSAAVDGDPLADPAARDYRTHMQTVAQRKPSTILVLRHTFGTTMIRQGRDIVVAAELMGHKRLDQTHRYGLPTGFRRIPVRPRASCSIMNIMSS